MTSFPSALDYMRAVQNPKTVFRDPTLQNAVFRVHPTYQVPRPLRGSHAVVFRATVSGQERALRFFLHDVGRPDHYRALERWITAADLRGNIAPPSWTDNAILVKNRRWPMVNTEWIEGQTLDSYITGLARDHDARALANLAVEWRSLIHTLQCATFAHGDLQHGNVLVNQRQAIRLVDLDWAWIGEFANQPAPRTAGHKNYQLREHEWGRWMDTFPGLVVYTGLLGLATHPQSWRDEWTQDKVLFTESDFAPPFTTPIWRRLESIGNPQLDHALQAMKACCTPGWRARCSLDDLLKQPQIIIPNRRWWEEFEHRTQPTPVNNDEPPKIDPDEPVIPNPYWYKNLDQKNAQPRVKPKWPHAIFLGVIWGVVIGEIVAGSGGGSEAIVVGLLVGLLTIVVVIAVTSRK